MTKLYKENADKIIKRRQEDVKDQSMEYMPGKIFNSYAVIAFLEATHCIHVTITVNLMMRIILIFGDFIVLFIGKAVFVAGKKLQMFQVCVTDCGLEICLQECHDILMK